MIRFGLEGTLRLIPLLDFEAITSASVPRPNDDKAKAARLHSFPLPDRFKEPGSQDRDRTINIFAAILTQEKAIIITDFSRMVRLHVISRTHNFLDFDITVESDVRNLLVPSTIALTDRLDSSGALQCGLNFQAAQTGLKNPWTHSNT
jgi:hypothetical protein